MFKVAVGQGELLERKVTKVSLVASFSSPVTIHPVYKTSLPLQSAELLDSWLRCPLQYQVLLCPGADDLTDLLVSGFKFKI